MKTYSLKKILEQEIQFSNVTEIAKRLNTHRKRIYEAVNILSELHMITRLRHKDRYTYNGLKSIPKMVMPLSSGGGQMVFRKMGENTYMYMCVYIYISIE